MPSVMIKMSFVIHKGLGRPQHLWSEDFQKTSISRRGGKTRARALLAKAPTREMRPSRSGIARARAAGEGGGGGSTNEIIKHAHARNFVIVTILETGFRCTESLYLKNRSAGSVLILASCLLELPSSYSCTPVRMTMVVLKVSWTAVEIFPWCRGNQYISLFRRSLRNTGGSRKSIGT